MENSLATTRNSLLKLKELYEIYDLVFSDTHSEGFKAAETKDLLFDKDYWFLMKPKENWRQDLIDYLKANNIDKSKLSMNKALIDLNK